MFTLYGTIFAGYVFAHFILQLFYNNFLNYSGVACGIYTTNSAEACEFILKDSGSEIVVVENKDQLEKILKCKDKCNLKSIIQYKGEVENNHNGLVMTVSIAFNHPTNKILKRVI